MTGLGKQSANWLMAASHAREFHRQTEQIFRGIPQGKEDANRHFAENQSLIVFYATNLIFACELYIKAIYAFQGGQVREGHNIWTLFKRLPKTDKENINTFFLEEMKMLPEASSMNLLLTGKELDEAQVLEELLANRNRANGDFLSLERALKDTGDSYQTWRYLFQKISHADRNLVVRYHWCHLQCFCRAMDRLLANTEKANGTVRV